MIVKTILSPQFSVMLPASLIATSLPPFSQCGQLPSLYFLFSPIFWRKGELRQDLALLPKLAWKTVWSQCYEVKARKFTYPSFQSGISGRNHSGLPSALITRWHFFSDQRKVLQGPEVSLGSVLPGLLPGHPQVPRGHNLFLIAFYIFFLLFCVTGISYMHV